MTPLIDALEAQVGLVCFVGAGGKKTLMFHIADHHSGRVAITATAHIEHLPKRYREALVVSADDLVEQVIALRHQRVVAFARPSELAGRYAGVADDELQRLMRDGGFAVCVVKSDGARGRYIKAPAAHEPPLPRHARLVVPVVSARALGRPLSGKVAHRAEQVAAVTGAAMGEAIMPEHVARLLASGDGALKGTAGCRVIPVINMVDDDERETLARKAAEQALGMTDRFDRVLLTAMKRERPLVAVIQR
jgi:probable selenium-dependent hydroxylase accessory protein YqeC